MPGGEGRCPWHLPGHWVAIRSGGARSRLGALASGVLQTVSPQGGQVVWFELEFDLLEGPIFPAVAYEAPPRYPGSWQDFSLVWDLDKGFAALEEVLSTFTHPLVIRREFVADYKGKGLPPGTGSYSYRFWLGAADHTLTSDEIEGFRAAILEFFKEREIPLR